MIVHYYIIITRLLSHLPIPFDCVQLIIEYIFKDANDKEMKASQELFAQWKRNVNLVRFIYNYEIQTLRGRIVKIPKKHTFSHELHLIVVLTAYGFL